MFLKGFTDNYVSQGQTEPPTIPIFQLYKDKPFPEGEIQEYIQPFNAHRMTSEEVRANGDRGLSCSCTWPTTPPRVY